MVFRHVMFHTISRVFIYDSFLFKSDLTRESFHVMFTPFHYFQEIFIYTNYFHMIYVIFTQDVFIFSCDFYPWFMYFQIQFLHTIGLFSQVILYDSFIFTCDSLLVIHFYALCDFTHDSFVSTCDVYTWFIFVIYVIFTRFISFQEFLTHDSFNFHVWFLYTIHSFAQVIVYDSFIFLHAIHFSRYFYTHFIDIIFYKWFIYFQMWFFFTQYFHIWFFYTIYFFHM